MANFWVIMDRTEGNPREAVKADSANVGVPREIGSTKLAAQRPREAETKARWSGAPETARVILVEAGSAAEARQNIQALFPTWTTQATVSIEENKFLEPAS